ncbi:hypothetical protein [Streptosporangium sp. NPDC023615]|uniref:hypothetical protein n=1 Tax=Streptosporangium sp. NPDC023615 TaxID=3154794 RepID=UPI00343568B0
MSSRRDGMSHRARWPGLAAAAWGFVFAVPSFYWALGGTAGGIAFVLAARAHLRTVADRRHPRIAGIVGGLGALALSAVALMAGIG